MSDQRNDFERKFKGNLNDIKSKFITLKIFSFLNEKKYLEIIKINKKFQKKLNINISNYKDYFENIHFIEIEVKVKRNAKKFIYFFKYI